MMIIKECDSYLIDCQNFSGGKITKKDTDGQPCSTYSLTACFSFTEILENEHWSWGVNRRASQLTL